ncbi:amylo-alpha-1,6-glucosidase [Nitriliruptoraceae bacterium ZYF776]|nr:amylo-alpha-1,6-glucosidase [Profundirhabdus halotolerans]
MVAPRTTTGHRDRARGRRSLLAARDRVVRRGRPLPGGLRVVHRDRLGPHRRRVLPPPLRVTDARDLRGADGDAGSRDRRAVRQVLAPRASLRPSHHARVAPGAGGGHGAPRDDVGLRSAARRVSLAADAATTQYVHALRPPTTEQMPVSSSPGATGPLTQVTCVRGESFVVSAITGDVTGGDEGYYVRDTRFLDRLLLRVDGRPPTPLHGGATGPGTATFHGFLRDAASHATDPALLVTRVREVDGGLWESFAFANHSDTDRTHTVELELGTDLAYIFDVKHGRELPRVSPAAEGDRVFVAEDPTHGELTVRAAPRAERDGAVLRWQLHVLARDTCEIQVGFEARDVYGTVLPPTRHHPAPGTPVATEPPGPAVRCSDGRVTNLVQRSLGDLATLGLADPEQPEDRFPAAGSPWYLTLFGRDACWTARMALPFDPELARGTLRALARRQGQRDDPDTEEQPGRILHEVRRGSLTHRGDLPPNYYGTVDATPLWVTLLSEAWRWGLAAPDVEALLDPLEAALGWIGRQVDDHPSGWLAYRRPGERGLVNQGWKDSHDGVQFRDGRLAEAPIALVEVQAYAYEAAVRGAELLERFGRPGADRWRTWADALRDRFRAHFWTNDALGRYPGIAIDASGSVVDGATSNIGHLLGTGLLDADEEAAVAARLVHPTLASGWGLRTLAADSRGYNPLGYHTGSVWPHDTAIAVEGAARAGARDTAVTLLEGLVGAGPHFRHRLPELFGGQPATPDGFPVPYPVACRPQAWAAGAALLLVRALLGAQACAPDGRLELRPLWPAPFHHLEVRGLRVGDARVDVTVDDERGVEVECHGAPLAVELQLGT